MIDQYPSVSYPGELPSGGTQSAHVALEHRTLVVLTLQPFSSSNGWSPPKAWAYSSQRDGRSPERSIVVVVVEAVLRP